MIFCRSPSRPIFRWKICLDVPDASKQINCQVRNMIDYRRMRRAPGLSETYRVCSAVNHIYQSSCLYLEYKVHQKTWKKMRLTQIHTLESYSSTAIYNKV